MLWLSSSGEWYGTSCSEKYNLRLHLKTTFLFPGHLGRPSGQYCTKGKAQVAHRTDEEQNWRFSAINDQCFSVRWIFEIVLKLSNTSCWRWSSKINIFLCCQMHKFSHIPPYHSPYRVQQWKIQQEKSTHVDLQFFIHQLQSENVQLQKVYNLFATYSNSKIKIFNFFSYLFLNFWKFSIY